MLAARETVRVDAVQAAHRRRGPPVPHHRHSRGGAQRRGRAPPRPSTSCSCRPPPPGLTHDWLTRLLGYSAQTGIAAAGPVLLAPDGRIHQAGIALPDGIPLHVMHAAPLRYAPSVVHNVSAVSGILATPRATYQQLGGLDPTYGELALIDYCLRAGQENLRTVIVPDARLRTTGPDPTTNDLPAIWRLRQAWAATPHLRPLLQPQLPHRPRRLCPPALLRRGERAGQQSRRPLCERARVFPRTRVHRLQDP